MKFAAIADVHGNCVALEAVLADIAAVGITDVVNLGDHVSGPLEARRTADLLIERGFPSIRGDQDRRLVEIEPGTGASNRGDYRQLDRKHLDWMASQPPTMVYRNDIFLCHGSPRSDATYWLDQVTNNAIIQASPIEDVEAEVTGIAASLILCGHTHIPRVVRLRDGRLVVNPGSVGCPGYAGQKPVSHKVEAGPPMPATPFSNLHGRGGEQQFGTCRTTTCRWLNWREETNSQYGPVRWLQVGFDEGSCVRAVPL